MSMVNNARRLMGYIFMSSIIAGVATASSIAARAQPFGINIGATEPRSAHGSVPGFTVVWVSGQDKCQHTSLAVVGMTMAISTSSNNLQVGNNPCGIKFSLNGQSWFTLEGCGGPIWINQNGNFWANCAPLSEDDGSCVVHSEYHCQ
jgi:hypothetical protein